MSTRGLAGFRVDGKDYLSYNHSDSYPSWLGKHVIRDYLQHLPKGEDLKNAVRQIQLVEAREHISEDDFKRVFPAGDKYEPSLTWYDLLREAQGDLQAYLDLKVMTDDAEFILDSLFCEWAYILNLDDEVFEVYKGFNKSSRKGRYVKDGKSVRGYLPCKLIFTEKLAALSECSLDKLIKAFG